MEDEWHKIICQEALLCKSCYRIYETERVLSSWNMILYWKCNPLAGFFSLKPGAAPVERDGDGAPVSETQ